MEMQYLYTISNSLTVMEQRISILSRRYRVIIIVCFGGVCSGRQDIVSVWPVACCDECVINTGVVLAAAAATCQSMCVCLAEMHTRELLPQLT